LQEAENQLGVAREGLEVQQRPAVSGGTGCHGRGFKSFSDFILFKTYSNLIQSKTCLPNLQNFKLKYGAVGFEIWNDFPYSNFFIFGVEFELKFREPI
jgi:hypothetical protein